MLWLNQSQTLWLRGQMEAYFEEIILTLRIETSVWFFVCLFACLFVLSKETPMTIKEEGAIFLDSEDSRYSEDSVLSVSSNIC